jgi:hypothetical protein
VGRWAVPRDLRFIALMSDSKLDLTSAVLPVGGVVNIDVTAIMASVRIIVPPGMRVINEMHAVMASVTSKAHEMDRPGDERPGATVIRLTGTAIMAEVKVVVRKLERAYDDDDDDDDDEPT